MTAAAPAPAEDFLSRAMSLDNLITRLGDTSSSSPIPAILEQVHEDLVMYSQISRGNVPPGASAAGVTGVVAPGSPLTNEQMQDAAWMQSGATQAEVIIRQFLFALSKSPITTDAQKIYADITGDSTGIHLDEVTGDLQTFLHDIEVVAAPINNLVDLREPDGSLPPPRSGAGALIRYLGPTIRTVNDATSRVNAFLDPSAISQLNNELTVLSQGRDRP